MEDGVGSSSMFKEIDQEFSCGHIKFEMLIGYLSRNIKSTVGCTNLYFQKESKLNI